MSIISSFKYINILYEDTKDNKHGFTGSSAHNLFTMKFVQR